MAALVATRVRFLVGDALLVKKLPKISRAISFHRTAYLLNQFSTKNGPLTLESLGFRDVSDTITKFEKSKGRQIVSTLQVIQDQVEEVKPRRDKVKTKAVAVENPIEVDLAPFSAKSFSELGLPPLLIEALEREGFNVPTDVQSAAIPTILKNHDAVIQSYTGSGKTLAYVLPVLSKVGPLSGSPNSNKEDKKKTDIEAVIIAPSRELGMQIVREIEKLLGPENKRFVQQLVGGANRSRQEEALKKNKPVIVVGTPGRIAEISSAGKLHTHGCRYLILDEIDQLLSFNFREDMHRIIEHVGKKADSGPTQNSETQTKKRVERQMVMVSATVPFSVIRAARSWGRDPILVQAKKVAPLESIPRPAGPVNLLTPGPSSSSNAGSDLQQTNAVSESLPPSLKHYYCVSRLQHKVDTVRRCVHALDAKTVIVFMNHTRQLKDAVFKLQARGLVAEELHGDLGKLSRSTILKKFKKGEIRVLVTNELSARGLDVSNCDLVVNVDLPTDSVHYAHRAGRTGRLGRKGSVVTICEESEVFVVRKLQRQLGVPIQSCEFAEGKLVMQEEK